MPNELWEVVRFDELKVGDVVWYPDNKITITTLTPGQTTTLYTREGSGEVFWEDNDEEMIRRYDGPSPEVLMRALENACSLDQWLPGEFRKALAARFIAEAEAEIAAETKGGAN